MNKSNKELAVELACAALIAMSRHPKQDSRPLSEYDINDLLTSCYYAVHSLPDNSADKA